MSIEKFKDILFTKVSGNDEELSRLQKEIAPSLRKIKITLYVILFLFIIWGGFAQIDSAAIAPGNVVLGSNRKTIQHFEGGVIEQILVKEGEHVKEGQELIILNDKAPKAKYAVLSNQLSAAKAMETRLIAEQNEQEKIDFNIELTLNANDEEIKKLIGHQKQLFETRRKYLKDQITITESQISQQKDRINGVEKQISSMQAQLKLTQEEKDSVKKLYDKGLAIKSNLLNLERRISEIEGKIAEYKSDILMAKDIIIEAESKIIALKSDYQKEVANMIKENNQQIRDIEEQLQAVKDVLVRTKITAPVAGIVNNMKYHTIGGVISPGVPILDIIPQDDKLLIEVQISPQDIDVVHVGLDAKVALSAYKTRFLPRLDGKVVYISADRHIDEKTGRSYFLARIEIKEEELKRENINVSLYPGMPAEVFIVTGSRTLLGYLISPLWESVRRGFKEE